MGRSGFSLIVTTNRLSLLSASPGRWCNERPNIKTKKRAKMPNRLIISAPAKNKNLKLYITGLVKGDKSGKGIILSTGNTQLQGFAIRHKQVQSFNYVTQRVETRHMARKEAVGWTEHGISIGKESDYDIDAEVSYKAVKALFARGTIGNDAAREASSFLNQRDASGNRMINLVHAPARYCITPAWAVNGYPVEFPIDEGMSYPLHKEGKVVILSRFLNRKATCNPEGR